ncbi:MAG: S-layer family protein, partial [Rivularia sp. (in: Bacteria)]|nr:S-layer family protein [Rivularia sp. MS3]
SFLAKDGVIIGTRTSGKGNGGNLSIDAQNVLITGDSSLLTFSEENSTGDSGDLTITANSFLAKDGVIIGTRTSGKGKGGDLTVKTNSLLTKDNVLINTNASGEGNGGNLSIDAQNVQITGDSQLLTSSGENSTGDLGNLMIKTNNLLVKDGAGVRSSLTSEKSNGGNLNINAQDVQLIGSLSGISLFEGENSTGIKGNITIKTNTLLIKDGAYISNTTAGKGSGGNLNIDAQDVQLIGSSSDLSTFTFPNSTGDAGNITIKTNTLLFKDEATIYTTTFGEGNGGNLNIDAQDVQLIGNSSLSSFTNSIGDAGDITIKTNSLLIKDGSDVTTDTLGKGNAGNLTVDAQDVQLIGESKDGQFSSSLSSDAAINSTGDGGDLTIRTNNLLVKDGAQITAATFGQGKGGNVNVDAKNVQIIGKTRDNQFPSGLFTSAQENSTRDAGNLIINADILQIEDGAWVSVASAGTGRAGNITINADFIRLNNDGLITGNTRNNNNLDTEQATININSQELIMRDGSRIRTNATGENVIGGNININTDFLIANENSDISANSENFRGGNVRIDAEGIFGTQFRLQPTSQSDITATGASPELNGTVEIITPQTDPTSGSIKFPTIPVETQIADVCSTPGYAQSSFTITGKDSLPPSPLKPLPGRLNQTKLATLEEDIKPQATRSRQNKKQEPEIKEIVEARGWVRTPDGRIILVAHAPNGRFSSPPTASKSCSYKNS